MRRAAALCIVIGSTGCFAAESVNQRPSLDIRPESSEPVYREDPLVLHAIAADPEQQIVRFRWQVYLCDDATDAAECDAAPHYTGSEQTARFTVPSFRAGAREPNQALRVVLEGTDDLGAAALPPQLLLIPVLDHPPVLALRKDVRYGAVVGAPIDLYARFGDPDDAPANVELDWTVFAPAQVPDALIDLAVEQDPRDPAHRQVGKRLVPEVTGEWDIRVIATDLLGASVEQHIYVTVVDDAPPCLETWQPIAPAGDQLYPLIDPTLFQVAVVRDELDVYPPVPSDPVLGTTRFMWSLQADGGPRLPLATTANRVALDPASYVPGATLELRVQIFDRENVSITCDDAAPTCAVDASRPTCLQRLTWRVEVR